MKYVVRKEKSRLWLSTVLLPLFFFALNAGTPDTEPSGTLPFNRLMSGPGKIGKAAIHMEIHVKGKKITGHYSYDKYRIPITLTGSLEKNNGFALTETDDKGRITGYFTGAIVKGLALEGRWLDASQKKSLPFGVDCSKHHELLSLKKENKYTEIDVQYVRLCNFEDFELQEKLNRKLRRLYFSDMSATEGEIPKLITKEDVERKPKAYSYLPYRLYIRSEVEYFSYPVVLSLGIHKNGFTGGAHGWYYSNTFNFDFRTQKEITINDLFIDPIKAKKAIADFCKTEILEEAGENGNTDSIKMEKLEPGSESFGETFTISWVGVELYFFNIYPFSNASAPPTISNISFSRLIITPYLRTYFNKLDLVGCFSDFSAVGDAFSASEGQLEQRFVRLWVFGDLLVLEHDRVGWDNGRNQGPLHT